MPTVFSQAHWPNRLTPHSATSGSTSWRILATDGTWHQDYPTLLAAGKTQWPGSPADFPQGVPYLALRTLAASGLSVGSPILYKTNTLITPSSDHDADGIVLASDPPVEVTGGVKNLWVRQISATDYCSVQGRF